MSTNRQILEETQTGVLRQPGANWFAVLSSSTPADLSNYDRRLVTGNGTSVRMCLSTRKGTSPPLSAERRGCGVIFDGALFNRQDLLNELGDLMTPGGNDAETILAGYDKWGEQLFARLRGFFALVLWDTEREVFYCLRDPIGSCPLFYTRRGDDYLFSTSIDVLLEQPRVSSEFNRAALADFLIDRFTVPEETYFKAIKRVRRGFVMRIKGSRQEQFCYWDPAPEGTVNWIKPEELERFDELLNQAVRRCLSFGPAAILLSGGLDSGSVAAVATEQCRIEGLPTPVAMSLFFPEPAINEEVAQRAVARQLGLPLVTKEFYEAIGTRALLQPAMELTASLPSPLLNTWWPAYYGLTEEGAKRGCRIVLTGNGGDEWLTISPFLAADYLRTFNVGGVLQLWKSIYRSYHEPTFALFRNFLWRWGFEPLLVPPVHRIVKGIAPWAIPLRHRIVKTIPDWLAPDPTLRDELQQRRYGRVKDKREKPDSYYLRAVRTCLDMPQISMVAEEAFHIGQRLGACELHPFWDADLVDLLYRTPPFLLNREGRNKGLVRSTLARRFPEVGFDQQRKMGASDFYADSIYRESPEAFRRLGGIQTLADLKIIDEPGLQALLEAIAGRHSVRKAYHVWKVLNLESWARAHAS